MQGLRNLGLLNQVKPQSHSNLFRGDIDQYSQRRQNLTKINSDFLILNGFLLSLCRWENKYSFPLALFCLFLLNMPQEFSNINKVYSVFDFFFSELLEVLSVHENYWLKIWIISYNFS